jgi:hypothetical protein
MSTLTSTALLRMYGRPSGRKETEAVCVPERCKTALHGQGKKDSGTRVWISTRAVVVKASTCT